MSETNYAVQLLQEALRVELIAKETASQFKGIGFQMDNMTIKAFDESRRLANERIPQLMDALEKIQEVTHA